MCSEIKYIKEGGAAANNNKYREKVRISIINLLPPYHSGTTSMPRVPKKKRLSAEAHLHSRYPAKVPS